MSRHKPSPKALLAGRQASGGDGQIALEDRREYKIGWWIKWATLIGDFFREGSRAIYYSILICFLVFFFVSTVWYFLNGELGEGLTKRMQFVDYIVETLASKNSNSNALILAAVGIVSGTALKIFREIYRR